MNNPFDNDNGFDINYSIRNTNAVWKLNIDTMNSKHVTEILQVSV